MQEFAQSIKICFLLRFSSRCQDSVPFFKKLLQRLEAYITRIMARKNIQKDTIFNNVLFLEKYIKQTFLHRLVFLSFRLY